MSIEAKVYTLLSPLVAGRVYPDVAPNGVTTEYITYQQIGGQVINPLANVAPGKRNAFMQINVWARTRLAAANLALQIEDAMRGSATFTGRPQAAPIAVREPDTGLYGTMQDFSCWFDR